MNLFDTHAHLDDDRFRDDLPAVIDRATAAGVTHVVCVATTAADSGRCVEIAGRHPSIWASVGAGIQPNTCRGGGRDWDRGRRPWPTPRRSSPSARPGSTGIGTTRRWRGGKTISPATWDLAHAAGLPVVIHCREAEADVVRMLRTDFTAPAPSAASCTPSPATRPRPRPAWRWACSSRSPAW